MRFEACCNECWLWLFHHLAVGQTNTQNFLAFEESLKWLQQLQHGRHSVREGRREAVMISRQHLLRQHTSANIPVNTTAFHLVRRRSDFYRPTISHAPRLPTNQWMDILYTYSVDWRQAPNQSASKRSHGVYNQETAQGPQSWRDIIIDAISTIGKTNNPYWHYYSIPRHAAHGKQHKNIVDSINQVVHICCPTILIY